MALATDEGNHEQRRWAELSDAQKTAIVFTVVSAALAIPFLILQGFYLNAPAGCDIAPDWTEGPMKVVGPLGLFAVLFGVTAGIWASTRRPRLIGLAAIALNLGLLVLGLVFLALDFGHSFELCMIG
jgi:hypothetical protein